MDSPEAMIGQQLGQYQVDQHLSRSNMADVYLATHLELERQDVLKVLLPFFSHDPVFVQRFRSEAKTMAKLHHPNLVQVYASGMTPDQRPYIVIQYIRGGSLEDKLRELGKQQQVFATAMALAITRQVASGLSLAHKEGIVHRDMKPGNILLDPELKPFITDFGIAISVNEPRLTQSNILMGTPEYMSPEQARQEPLDGRSDIYSLGVVLYQMLVGRLPFIADSPWTIIHKQINEQEVPIKKLRADISSTTNAVVAKCLQKEPAKRFQTANELAAALDDALRVEGVVVPTTKSGAWTRPLTITGTIAQTLADVGKNGKNWWVKAAAAAVAVLLLGTAAWFFTRPPATSPATPPGTTIAEFTTTPQEVIPTSTLLSITSTLASDKEMVKVTNPDIKTPTSEPTNTSTVVTSTPSPEPATLTPTPTAIIVGSAQVQANSPVFLFSGPGGRTNYRVVGALEAGETVEALYRSRGLNYYVIRRPSGHLAWVYGDHVTALNEPAIRALPTVATVPAVEVTPTPRLAITSVPTESPDPPDDKKDKPDDEKKPVDP